MCPSLPLAQGLLILAGVLGIGLILSFSQQFRWSIVWTTVACGIVLALTVYAVSMLPPINPPVKALTATDKEIEALKEKAEKAGESGAQKALENFMKSQPLRSLKAGPSLTPPPMPPPPPMVTVHSLAQRQKALEREIDLFEFYPKYEWPKSGYTTTEPIMVRGITFKAGFEKDKAYRLTPLIWINNDGIPLYDPRITVLLPLDIKVQLSNE